MKTILFFAVALLIGCSNPADPSPAPAAPVITVVSIYGNDAIDATIEYSITGPVTETFLFVDDKRIDVAKGDTLYSGTFPAHAVHRSIVAINAGTKSTKDF